MKKTLSRLEHKLLSYIATFVDKHGYQPTYREIAVEWGYKSPGYIHALVSRMKDRGIVSVRGFRAVHFDYKTYID